MSEIKGEYITPPQEEDSDWKDAQEMLGAGYGEADAQAIIDPSDLRKYRIELPNLYDDADLDVYEFRLLAHYKRVGRCTEGTHTTAKKTGMSAGQVSQKRVSLAEKGFINMREIPLKNGGFSYIIMVIDRWEENFKKYSAMRAVSPHESAVSPHEGPFHSVKQRINHIKNLTTTTRDTTQNIFAVYQNNIGMITPILRDTLLDAEKDYGPEWVCAAIKEAVTNEKRNWSYCAAILKRWKQEGFQSEKVKPKQTTPSVKPTGLQERLARA